MSFMSCWRSSGHWHFVKISDVIVVHLSTLGNEHAGTVDVW